MAKQFPSADFFIAEGLKAQEGAGNSLPKRFVNALGTGTTKLAADVVGLGGELGSKNAQRKRTELLAEYEAAQEKTGPAIGLLEKTVQSVGESLPALIVSIGPGRALSGFGPRAAGLGMGGTQGLLTTPDVLARGRELGNTGGQQTADVLANMAIQGLLPMAMPKGVESLAHAPIPVNQSTSEILKLLLKNVPKGALDEGVEELAQDRLDLARKKFITRDPNALPILPSGDSPEGIDSAESAILNLLAGAAMGGPAEAVMPAAGLGAKAFQKIMDGVRHVRTQGNTGGGTGADSNAAQKIDPAVVASLVQGGGESIGSPQAVEGSRAPGAANGPDGVAAGKPEELARASYQEGLEHGVQVATEAAGGAGVAPGQSGSAVEGNQSGPGEDVQVVPAAAAKRAISGAKSVSGVEAVKFAIERMAEGKTIKEVLETLREKFGLNFAEARRIANDVFAVETKPLAPSKPEDLFGVEKEGSRPVGGGRNYRLPVDMTKAVVEPVGTVQGGGPSEQALGSPRGLPGPEAMVGRRVRYRGGKFKGEMGTIAEVMPSGQHWVVRMDDGTIRGKEKGIFSRVFEVLDAEIPKSAGDKGTKATVSTGDVGVLPKTEEAAQPAADGREGSANVGAGSAERAESEKPVLTPPQTTIPEVSVEDLFPAERGQKNARDGKGFSAAFDTVASRAEDAGSVVSPVQDLGQRGAIRAEDVPEGYNTKGKDDPEAQRFVLSPDGSLDWGAIDSALSKEIGRQAGPIRLQVGWHGGPGKGFGLVHLQLGDKKSGRDLGLLSSVLSKFDEIYQDGMRLILVKRGNGKRQDSVFVELVPGDHYSVITAYGIRNNALKGEPLWIRSRYPNHVPRPETPGLPDTATEGRNGPPKAAQQSVAHDGDSLKAPEKGNAENSQKGNPDETTDNQGPITEQALGGPRNERLARAKEALARALQKTGRRAKEQELLWNDPALRSTHAVQNTKGNTRAGQGEDGAKKGLVQAEARHAHGEKGPKNDPRVKAFFEREETVRLANGESLVGIARDYFEDRMKPFEVVGQTVNKPEDAAALFALLRSPFAERFSWMVTDSSGSVVGSGVHSVGSISSTDIPNSILDARAILSAAKKAGDGARVWVAHNHPTGNPEPSGADRVAYRKLKEKFRTKGIDFSGVITNGKRFAYALDGLEFAYGEYDQRKDWELFDRSLFRISAGAPELIAQLSKRIVWDKGAVLTIAVDAQMGVAGVGVSGGNVDFSDDLRLASGTGESFVFVAQDRGVWEKIIENQKSYSTALLDVILLNNDGTVVSALSHGSYSSNRVSLRFGEGDSIIDAVMALRDAGVDTLEQGLRILEEVGGKDSREEFVTAWEMVLKEKEKEKGLHRDGNAPESVASPERELGGGKPGYRGREDAPFFSPRRTPGESLSTGKNQEQQKKQEAISEIINDGRMPSPIDLGNIPKGESMKNMDKDIQNWAKIHLANKQFINKETGWDIAVSMNGINHAHGNAIFPGDLMLTKHLPEILENAVFADSQPEKSGNSNISRVIKMVMPVTLEGKPRQAWITIKEYADVVQTKRHYHHELLKIDMTEENQASVISAKLMDGTGKRTPDGQSLPLIKPDERILPQKQHKGNGQYSGQSENKDPQPEHGPGRDTEVLPRPTSVGDGDSLLLREFEGNEQDVGPLYGPKRKPAKKRVIFPRGNKSIDVLIDWAKDTLPTMRMQDQESIDQVTDADKKAEIQARLDALNSVDVQAMEEHMRAFPQHYLEKAEQGKFVHPAYVFLERHDAPPMESRLAVDTIPMAEGEWKAPDTKQAIEDLEAALKEVMKKPPSQMVSKGLPESADGMFNPKNRSVTTRWHNALDTVAHEIAHAVEEEIGLVKEAETDKDIRNDLWRASQHGTTETDPQRKLHEGMAEVVRGWMVAPEQARVRYPAAVAFLESKAEPKIIGPLREYGNKVRRFFGSSAIGRMAAVHSSTVDAAEKERQERGIFQILKDLAYATIGRRSRNEYKRESRGQVPSGWRRDRARKMGGKMKALGEWMDYHFNDADAPMINNWNLAVMMSGVDPEKMRPTELLPRWLDFVRGSGGRIRDMILRHGLAGRDLKPASFSSGERITLGNLVDPLAKIAVNDGDMGKLLDTAHAVGSAQRTLEIAGHKREKLADAIAKKIEEKMPQIKELPTFRKEQAERDLQNEIEGMKEDTRIEIEKMTAAGGELESSEEVAKQALAEFQKMDEKTRAAIDEYLSRYRQWGDWNLQYRVDSGMLSEAGARKIRGMNWFYIDWHRVFADEKSGIDGAVKGSTRTIQNPLISLLIATEKTVTAGDRNFLMGILTEPLRLAQKVNNGLALAELGRLVPEADAQEAYKHHNGLIEHNGAPAKLYKMQRIVSEEQEDGPPIEKLVTEHWVFDAATEASLEIAKDQGSDHPWIAAMAMVNSLQRASIVLTPAFSLRTLTRDNVERIMVSEGSTSAEGYQAWWEEELEGRNIQELYDLSGSSLAGMTGRTRDQVMRDVMAEILAKDGGRWSNVANFAKKYQHFQEWAEGVSRKTEFAQAWTELRKKHPDWTMQDVALESMSRSRNLLDTAKKGAFIGRMNALTLFLNAGIKGMIVNTRLARKMYAAARAGKTEDAATLAGALSLRVGMMAAASMVIRWMVLGMNDDEKQKKLMAEPGFMRDFSFRIDVPGMPRISIAKPYEMGWFTSGAERLADAMWAKGKGWNEESARQVTELGKGSGWLGGLKTIGLHFKPEDIGGSMLPMIEILANKDFFRNSTIVSPWETGEAVSRRKGTERASGLGKVAQAMSLDTVDARNADHFIQSFFGGFGRMATAKDGTGFLRTSTGMVGGSDSVSGSRDVRWVLEKLSEIGQGQGRESRGLQRLLKNAREAKTEEAREKAEQTALRVAAGLRKSLEKNPKRWEQKE